jgi:hypothetical protein
MRKTYFATVLVGSMLCFNFSAQHIETEPKPVPTSSAKSFLEVLMEKQTRETLKYNRKPENIKAYTLSSMKKYGWGKQEYSCLYSLWKKESNWKWYSHNKSSGAYGIPQATPGWKMRHAGADWKTNPFTQISWGLNYIKRNHGTPCIAWRHSEVNNWY